jgi:hypothetical protein
MVDKNLQNHINSAFASNSSSLADLEAGTYVNQVTTFVIPTPTPQGYNFVDGGGVMGVDSDVNFYLPIETKYAKWTGSEWVLVSKNEHDELFAKKDLFQEDYLDQSRYTPTLDKDQSARFPEDVALHGASDFVIFDFFDYKPPFQNITPPADVIIKEDGNNNAIGRTKRVKQQVFNQSIDAYNQTGVANQFYTPDRENFPQLILYMPDDISDTLAAGWEGKSFGTTTASALTAFAQKGTLKKFTNSLTETKKLIEKSPSEAAAALATTLAKSITGDQITASDVFGSVSGVIRNPNAEVLFQKMNFRTFNLTFKMAPNNRKEAEQVMTIVKTFRKAMLPQYGLNGTKVVGFGTDEVDGEEVTTNAGLDAAFIKVPKVCSVSYMRGPKIHPYLPRYKMCAITDVAVNYTPDGNYAIFDDGMPVAVELRVSFMETKLLFAEDVGEVYGKPQITAKSGTPTGGFDENVGGGY